MKNHGVATLDPETEEGKDYTIVNKAVWKLLSSWYCKDKKYEMCRQVIGKKGNLSIEVRPTLFCCSKADKRTGDPDKSTTCAVLIGREFTVKDIIAMLGKKFSKDPTLCRLWCEVGDEGSQQEISPWRLLAEDTVFSEVECANNLLLDYKSSKSSSTWCRTHKYDGSNRKTSSHGDSDTGEDQDESSFSDWQILKEVDVYAKGMYGRRFWACGIIREINLPKRKARVEVFSDHGESRGSRAWFSMDANLICPRLTHCTQAQWDSVKGVLRGQPAYQGFVGLRNLGNTCYMNSAIQCLNHTMPLVNLMRDKKRLRQCINRKAGFKSENNELVLTFASLVQDIWSGSVKSYKPKSLKKALVKVNSNFEGYEQQDAQELIVALVDGLHEDCNRISKKPTFERKDWSPEIPEQTWFEQHREWNNMREDSVIDDMFKGFMRNHISCPECGRESLHFEPFKQLMLPLPTPQKLHKEVSIVFFPADTKKLPVWFMMDAATAQSITTVGSLKQWLCDKINKMRKDSKIQPSALLFQRRERIKFRTLVDTDGLTLPNHLATSFKTDSIGNDLYAHEMVANKRSIEIQMRARDVYTTRTYSRPSRVLKQVGIPFFIHVDKGTTHREVQRMVWHRVKFIAWSVEYWKRHQNNVAAGKAESEYPFEVAARPQSINQGERVDVWWENDNAVYSGVASQCVFDKSGALNQVELRYDDGDVKVYGGNSRFDLSNLLERVHQANCLRAMCPYNIVVGSKDADITMSIAYRNKAQYVAKKLFPRSDLTSSLAYDDEPMYLLPQHFLIVNWFKENNSKNVADGRYSDNKVSRNNRYPGARSPSLDKFFAATWDYMQPDPAFPRKLQLLGLDDTLSELNGIYTLDNLQYYGYVRYKFERTFKEKSIFLFRHSEGLWYVGEDSTTIYMQSVPAQPRNVVWPTQTKWKLWKQGRGWSKPDPNIRFIDPDADPAAKDKQVAADEDDGLPSLHNCLKLNSKPTQMDASNMWYCNKCENHVQGIQKLDIWVAPEVLVVVLKRFRVEKGRWSFYLKRKVTSLINFPIDGLDLSRFVKGNQPKDELIYDCFGICNHMGGTAGGHYTAYVRQLPGSTWIHCDDNRISTVSASQLVSPMAYVMFYQRRKKSGTT